MNNKYIIRSRVNEAATQIVTFRVYRQSSPSPTGPHSPPSSLKMKYIFSNQQEFVPLVNGWVNSQYILSSHKDSSSEFKELKPKNPSDLWEIWDFFFTQANIPSTIADGWGYWAQTCIQSATLRSKPNPTPSRNSWPNPSWIIKYIFNTFLLSILYFDDEEP